MMETTTTTASMNEQQGSSRTRTSTTSNPTIMRIQNTRVLSTIATVLIQLLSIILGLIDYLIPIAAVIARRILNLKLCGKGFGDFTGPEKARKELLEKIGNADELKEYLTIDIEWTKVSANPWFFIQEGRFLSPLHEFLPEESKTAYFKLVGPKVKSTYPPMYIMLLPSLGESFELPRMIIAMILAVCFGYSSLVLTAPYYGVRQPKDQVLFFVNTYADTILQLKGAVIESSALLNHFINQSDHNRMCLSGFSMGGGLAMFASVLSLVSGVDGERVGITTYAGAHDASLLLYSVIGHAVDWEVFRRNQSQSMTEIKKECAGIADLFFLNILDITMGILKKCNRCTIGAIRANGSSHDAAIPVRYTQEYHKVLSNFGTVVEDWIPGGHVTAAMFRPFYFTKMVVDTALMLATAKNKKA